MISCGVSATARSHVFSKSRIATNSKSCCATAEGTEEVDAASVGAGEFAAAASAALAVAAAVAFCCLLASAACFLAINCSAVGLDAAFLASFCNWSTRMRMSRASGDTSARSASLRSRCRAMVASSSAVGLPLHVPCDAVVTANHSSRTSSEAKGHAATSSAASASSWSAVASGARVVDSAGKRGAVCEPATVSDQRNVAPHGKWSDGAVADGIPLSSSSQRSASDAKSGRRPTQRR